MSRRAAVRVTENFERNLDDIRRFLEEAELSSAFGDLLDLLFGDVIPSLEVSPQIGFDFLARAPQSVEADARIQALRRRLGPDSSLREYIVGDYLLLYALGGERIHLLAIKHHRQLSFDLRALWRR
ncbi:type II toxin-antitoxin system RelE/ParE family toxin [Sorangium sp. So ce834]|uniref:type II toxin-antitoxin system RelE/ParE family toxin n=1 Tax=Sorangium sp. So ce834 TaxID=3133321 RepID=UPI003F6388A7